MISQPQSGPDKCAPLRGTERKRLAAELARRYAAGTTSIPELAARVGRGPALVRRLLIEAGVRTDDESCIRTGNAELAAELVARHQRGETVAQLSWTTGIDRRVVRRYLSAAGVPKPPRALPPGDTDAVVAGYRAGASIRELADRFGSSYTAVRTLLVQAGVGLRSRTPVVRDRVR
ncbi:hypothetical protein JOF53_003300 [Crossiella equi]|uniref:Helix-turn-helix domain-containing protein n=1 Tax=Crossiella equi TaxID=130796 RepID=A0ABS5ACW1_9PSEU|nr:helix-turn-helix domain-containing protein [Crossiella equi]MBP2474428.1 hypothetical protein [Crossiella equi]